MRLLADPGLVSSALQVAVLALAVWLTAVWLAGAVYVAVSYPFSQAHVPARSTGELLRAVLTECWCVLWTQPLLPLFQVLGFRLGSGGGRVPVVLVHGYFQNRVDFIYLVARLRAAGVGPMYAVNFFWPQKLERSSAAVRRMIAKVCAETGAEAVDIVTHSAGGLFALDVLSDSPELVRRAVLIAVPAGGVPWRGPLLGPSGSQLRADSGYTRSRGRVVESSAVLSVYSAHDNVVHPVETSRLEGPAVRNLEIDGPGHLAILFDRRVADAAADFLTAETTGLEYPEPDLPGEPTRP